MTGAACYEASVSVSEWRRYAIFKFTVNTAVTYHFHKPFNWELDKNIFNTRGGEHWSEEGGEE